MDLAVDLVRRGYRALPEEWERHPGATALTTRLLGRRTVVVRGREGAALFYDPGVVRRRGALPAPLRSMLFGRGGVQGLDGGDHLVRKRLFTDLLTEQSVSRLTAIVGHWLAAELQPGTARREVRLLDTLVTTYGAAALRWAGVGCADDESRRRARQMASLVDGFGSPGAAFLRGAAARLRLNRWAAGLVADVRARRRTVPEGALSWFATTQLDDPTAGVELLNVLRPTVAVAWPGVLAAAALSEHAELAATLAQPAAEAQREAFVHEVRRLAPFVPALAGRVRRDARHGNVQLRRGDRVVLDVPGTNTDPAWWTDPQTFDPGRFALGPPDPFAFVPQGGGDPATGHRCPGEQLTVSVLARTVQVLAATPFTMGPGEADPHRIPSLPPDRIVLEPLPSASAR